MNLFRVIQESINNTLKHAEANNIHLSITQQDKEISILVKDDGKGFDIKEISFGNGLSNIESRIASIDGQVFIQSELGKGTEIKIILSR